MRKAFWRLLGAALSALAERLDGSAPGDDAERLGPALVEFDWEGDISSCVPATNDPRDRFAAHSTLMHERLINRGFEERGRA